LISKPSKLQPALVGGLILGLGSSIPVLDYGNFCCCLWALVGGAVAARMLARRSPVLPVTSGDGAVAGLLSGLVGSAIGLLISVPIKLLLWSRVIEGLRATSDRYNDPAFRTAFAEAIRMAEQHPMLVVLLSWLMFSFVEIGVASLGGVIGVAFFEKRKGQTPPPPPQPQLPYDFNPPGSS